MKINNKIPGGLAIGTLGITIVGAFNGTTALLGLASITGGALALVTALLAIRQAEKKKLKPELAKYKENKINSSRNLFYSFNRMQKFNAEVLASCDSVRNR